MGKETLAKAKEEKNDEFYTQYDDIEKEINNYYEFNKKVFKDKVILLPCDDPEWSNFTKYFVSNFDRFGLKKLISTSYALSSKNKMVTDFEKNSAKYDEEQHLNNGKVFILTQKDKKVEFEDIEFEYLEGNGDFRSEEVRKFRDEADIIITNPPFSLFREFVDWIMEAKKSFAIIGNQNAITYKEIFPLIKNNKIWLGYENGDMEFRVPNYYEKREIRYREDENGQKWRSLGNICWFTNIDFKKRHEFIEYSTMQDNLKFNRKLRNVLKEKYGKEKYQCYDNYNAIEVPFTEAIPSDYKGVMGVPITFLTKYNPDQFEIIKFRKGNDDKDLCINGKSLYFRILIKFKNKEEMKESKSSENDINKLPTL